MHLHVHVVCQFFSNFGCDGFVFEIDHSKDALLKFTTDFSQMLSSTGKLADCMATTGQILLMFYSK